MAVTQRESRTTRREAETPDLEPLVVQLADEAEYWRSQAEALEGAVSHLRAERERLRREIELAEVWRQGLVTEVLELAPRGKRAVPIGLALGVPIGFVLWVGLLSLAYAAYSLFA